MPILVFQEQKKSLIALINSDKSLTEENLRKISFCAMSRTSQDFNKI